MRVITVALAIGLACGSSPAWAMQQEGVQRQAEGSKPLGRLGEHIFLIIDGLPSMYHRYDHGPGRFRQMNRADAAAGVWLQLRFHFEAQQSHIANFDYQVQKAVAEGEPRPLCPCSGYVLAAEYWRFEMLLRELTPEILATGVTQDEIDGSIKFIKSLFASHGVELFLPNGAWFPDVPEGHWAEPAIHNMRRAGILYGYPDGKYRM